MPGALLNNNLTLADCENCPLNGTVKVPSLIVDTSCVDILCIGQSPGYEEIRQGRPFIGRSGDMINPVMAKYSKYVAYVNALACRPLGDDGKDRTPAAKECKCCRDRIREDISYIISHYQPKIVLVFGATAKKEVNSLIKVDSQFKSLNIHMFEHPAYILRNRHLENRYIGELHNALKSVFGDNVADDIALNFVTYTNDVKHQFLEDVYSSSKIGVDIETNSLNCFMLSFVIGTVAVSCEKCTYFFDGRDKDIRTFEVLLDVLKDQKVLKVFANIMFDVVAFAQYGVEVNNFSDLFPLAFIHDNTYNEYNLEEITMRYKPEFAGYKAKFRASVSPDKILEAPTDELKRYNCFDAYVTRIDYDYIYAKMDEKSKGVFEKIAVKLLPVLVSMKITGMKIDTDLLSQYKTLFEGRFEEISKMFKEKWGITNINSPPQIKKWLFETLKLKSVKETATGGQSTDKEVLEVYADRVPDVRPLYEARRIASVLNYFLPSISEGLDDNEFIHPNYKHYGIQSHRLSCTSPNLQGIPRDETKIEFLDKYPLRRMFRARFSDSYVLEADFSQQEVRIVAELAKDEKMLAAFEKGEDIHAFVGSIVFGKPIAQITKFERQIAKGCVFGAIFGASADEMSMRLKISKQQAQNYLNRFFALFPNIESFIKIQHRTVESKNIVYTILGRPRKFLIHRNSLADAKREAGNHVIQALGADITFLSLIRIFDKLRVDGILNKDAYLMHTVHDSIMLDVRKPYIEAVANDVQSIMSGVPKLLGFKVAFPVEVTFGKRWGEKFTLKEVLN